MSKTTPLTALHMELGAKMIDFAGYKMPVVYSTIKEEHNAVRNGVGVFDVSHMGEFFVEGEGALALLQYVTTNDVSKLQPGKAQYSCLPNDQGGIVDDLLIYRLPDKNGAPVFMLVVNASNIEKDYHWITSQNRFGAQVSDHSTDIGLLAVQGPDAIKVLQNMTEVDLSAIKFYTFTHGTLAGVPGVLISATGYTGAGGFELYVPSKQLDQLWNAIFEVGQPFNIQPVGLGARDTLRLEKGYCLYGNDIDDTTSPIEAGLGWITKFKKGDFISKAVFQDQKTNGVNRKLVAFKMSGRRVPRHGYVIVDSDGNEIGQVTSGTLSPTLDYPIGMGYVPPAFHTPGTTIHIVMGRKQYDAEIIKLPFV